MKWNSIIGALVVSVGLCSQSFGFELLDRMLGAGCCQRSCCDVGPSCCEPEPTCCAEPVCCEPEPSCCDPCDSCCGHRDLFAGLRGLFDRGCCKSSCDSCCETTCCEPEPVCCEPEPTCCDPCNSCCNRGCSLFANLFKSRKSCCGGCGGCDSCGGCSTCGAGVTNGGGEPSPMPPAPMADPSASLQGPQHIIHASRGQLHRS